MTKRSTLRLYMEGDGKPVRRIARRYFANLSVRLSDSYDAPTVRLTVEPSDGSFQVELCHFAEGKMTREVVATGNLNDYAAQRGTVTR